MKFIIDIVKGIFVGVANIIPGVSGGTMAVSMGIYDRLISSITNLFKQFKKSVISLLPIGIGCVIGLVGFTYAIQYLLANQPFPTCLAFIGMILGGVPILVSNLKKGMRTTHTKFGAVQIIAFLVLFALVIVMPLMKSEGQSASLTDPGVFTIMKLFLVGIIASATMVIPGVSGSLVLMILGYYYGIIDTLKSFLDSLAAFEMDGILSGCIVLIPFGIGVLLGIFLIAKLIDYLFRKHSVTTYSAIMGLIVASPFAIIYNVMQESGMRITVLNTIAGVVLLAAGAVFTYIMGTKGEE